MLARGTLSCSVVKVRMDMLIVKYPCEKAMREAEWGNTAASHSR